MKAENESQNLPIHLLNNNNDDDDDDDNNGTYIEHST